MQVEENVWVEELNRRRMSSTLSGSMRDFNKLNTNPFPEQQSSDEEEFTGSWLGSPRERITFADGEQKHFLGGESGRRGKEGGERMIEERWSDGRRPDERREEERWSDGRRPDERRSEERWSDGRRPDERRDEERWSGKRSHGEERRKKEKKEGEGEGGKKSKKKKRSDDKKRRSHLKEKREKEREKEEEEEEIGVSKRKILRWESAGQHSVARASKTAPVLGGPQESTFIRNPPLRRMQTVVGDLKERHDSNLSLLSKTKAQVVGRTKIHIGSKEKILYNVEITSEGKNWTIQRKFGSFNRLNEVVWEAIPDNMCIHFPRKHFRNLFKSKSGKADLKEPDLKHFLHQFFSKPYLLTLCEVREFFEFDKHEDLQTPEEERQGLVYINAIESRGLSSELTVNYAFKISLLPLSLKKSMFSENVKQTKRWYRSCLAATPDRRQPLRMQIFEKTTMKKKMAGWVEIDLKHLNVSQLHDLWVPIIGVPQASLRLLVHFSPEKVERPFVGVGKDFMILLDHNDYLPGDEVTGRIVITLSHSAVSLPCKSGMNATDLIFRGESVAELSQKKEKQKDREGESVEDLGHHVWRDTVTHYSSRVENFFPDGERLEPGIYVWPFRFYLPRLLPPTVRPTTIELCDREKICYHTSYSVTFEGFLSETAVHPFGIIRKPFTREVIVLGSIYCPLPYALPGPISLYPSESVEEKSVGEKIELPHLHRVDFKNGIDAKLDAELSPPCLVPGSQATLTLLYSDLPQNVTNVKVNLFKQIVYSLLEGKKHGFCSTHVDSVGVPQKSFPETSNFSLSIPFVVPLDLPASVHPSRAHVQTVYLFDIQCEYAGKEPTKALLMFGIAPLIIDSPALPDFSLQLMNWKEVHNREMLTKFTNDEGRRIDQEDQKAP